jgi:hypothetical protein
MNTEQNYVGGGNFATTPPQTDATASNTSSQADNRQLLLETLRRIFEQESQWLAVIESQANDDLFNSLIVYLRERINLLNDGINVLSSRKYEPKPSINEEVEAEVRSEITNYISIALASHQRSCQNFNNGLIARGLTTIMLQPVSF